MPVLGEPAPITTHTGRTGQWLHIRSTDPGELESISAVQDAPRDVDVLVVPAGLMNTQGDALSGYSKLQITDHDDVAVQSLKSIGRKHIVASCWQTHMVVLLTTRLMSHRRAVTQMGKLMAAGLGKQR